MSLDRSLLPKNAAILAADMDARIVASGPRELDNLVNALGGRYLPGGGGGEPIRNPDAYPTGKNFYGVDPDKIPKPAAWEMGVKLADQMLADHVKKHGKYPEKVSFVIWGDETMRHEGVLESQIFHLLGTKPVWDVRGKVVDVEVIPQSRLGRPRVDIVIASAAEGMFHNVTMLMDKAVQQVKAIEEADNFVRRHYLTTKTLLMEKGPANRTPTAAPACGFSTSRRASSTSTPRRSSPTAARGDRVRGRLHQETRPRIRQRLLGRADGGCLPPGARGHGEGRSQQFDDVVRCAG